MSYWEPTASSLGTLIFPIATSLFSYRLSIDGDLFEGGSFIVLY